MNAKKECQSYVSKIFLSIKKNLDQLKDEESFEAFLKSINEFYASLFSEVSGCFESKGMEKSLEKIPQISKPPSCDEGESSTSQEQRIVAKGKGLGKGKPGCVRKPRVTKRQERRREDPEFAQRKRPLPSPSHATAQSPKRIAPNSPLPAATSPLQTTTCQSQSPASSSATTPHTTPSQSPAASPARSLIPSQQEQHQPPHLEIRQKLRAQTFENPKKSQVKLIQEFSEATKDTEPNSEELHLFWVVMNNWSTLDPDLVHNLKHWWHKIHMDKRTSLEEKLLLLIESPNGVTNCLHHLAGNLLYQSLKQSEMLDDTTNFFEEIEEKFQELHYAKYLAALRSCECEKCNSVLEFDESYERYHDSIETENREINDPVRIKDRPQHCSTTELIAQSLRAQFLGLSASSLQRWYHFSASTPRFSPPAITVASPTNVCSTTVKYLDPYLRERNLQQAIPRSWKTPKARCSNEKNLLPLRKESVHMCDGDSCEIRLSGDESFELTNLATHGQTIRVRMLSSDSPETEYSVRIYKQSENSTTYSTFITRHIGIECMRAARQMIFEAKSVFLQIERDPRGRPFLAQDDHKRRLAHLFLENSSGVKENFAQKLAWHGFTLSFYTTGVDPDINDAMRSALAEKKGIFNLPDEVFTFPNRPWDIRRLTSTGHTNVYDEYREILNRPSDPDLAWIPEQHMAQVDGGEDSGSVPQSETTDNFYLRIVPCKLFWESRCFVAESTIPNAGRGLFLQAHKDDIPVGTHLCMYAERSTTLEEIIASGSSRQYSIFTQKKKRWFDGEKETGNNIGRFANQPGVLDALHRIKQLSTRPMPAMIDCDWRQIETQLDDQCNAQFDTTGEQLVLKAKRPFHETYDPQEIFINYGGLKDYWIPLIVQHSSDTLLPREMTDIVEWLLHNDESNWTPEQRKEWDKLSGSQNI